MISETEIRKARRTGQMMGSIAMAELIRRLAGHCRTALSMYGYTVADDIDNLSQKLAGEIAPKIKPRYSGISTEEVGLAIESGTSGEWGKDCRPTTANCLRWVDAYAACEPRKNVIRALSFTRRGPDAADLLPQEEKDRLNEESNRRGALEEWQAYKRTGKLNIILSGYAAALYDYLYRLGKLRPTADTIKAAYIASRKRVAEAKSLSCVSELYRNFGKPATEQGMMDWECKRELLTMYFAQLKSRGVELTI